MGCDRQQQYWIVFPCSSNCLQPWVSSRPTVLPGPAPLQRCSLCFVSIKQNEKAAVAPKSWTLPLLFVSCRCRGGVLHSIMGDGYRCVCLNPKPAAAEVLFITMLLDLVSAGWLTEQLWSGFIRLELLLPVDWPFTTGLPPPSLLVCLLPFCLTRPTPRAPLTQRWLPVPVNQTQWCSTPLQWIPFTQWCVSSTWLGLIHCLPEKFVSWAD